MNEDISLNSLSFSTAVLFGVHVGSSIFGTLYGAMYLFFAEIKASNFILTGYTIVASLLIFGGVWLFKLLINFINDKLEVKEITRYRNDYLIVFGIIGIIATVVRIAVFFVEFRRISLDFELRPTDHAAFILLYSVFISSLYGFFIYPIMDKKCTWARADQIDAFLLKSLIAHVVLFIVTIRIAIGYTEIERKEEIIVCQITLSFLSIIAIPAFVYVLVDGLRLIDVERGREERVEQAAGLNEVLNKSSTEVEPTVMSKPGFVLLPR